MMALLSNISLHNKIRLVALPVIAGAFAISILIINYIQTNTAEHYTQRQAEVYLDQLEKLLNATLPPQPNGLDASVLSTIKPYFRRPAFAKTDFPFLASKQGTYLVHTLRKGQMLPLEMLATLKTTREPQGVFRYTERHGQQREQRVAHYRYYEPYEAYIGISVSPAESIPQRTKLRIVLICLAMLLIIGVLTGFNRIINSVVQRLNTVKLALDQLSMGRIPTPIADPRHDEVGLIADRLNQHAAHLAQTTEFVRSIGNTQAQANFQALGPNDTLGHALIDLRNDLDSKHQQEQQRQQEDSIRRWTNEGIAKFAAILQHSTDDLQSLGDEIIQNLVTYIDANQGGLFTTTHPEDGPEQLELLSAFAYNRKKFIHNTIAIGEGLVGTCAIERQTIYLTEIPEGYISITSGLGQATPSCLLIVPLKVGNTVLGVVELASLNPMAPHIIDFVEKIGSNIASTMSSAIDTQRTKQLLEQSQTQREQMSAQEEEMRQNMEEMQATQEEMARKQVELEGITNAINAGFAFAHLSTDGAVMNPNNKLLSLVGMSFDEMDGKLLSSLVNEAQRETLSEQWHRVLHGETVELSLQLGTAPPIALTIAPGLDDSGTLVRIYMIGLQSLQQQQQWQGANLQQAEMDQLLLQALNQSCLVAVLEPSGRILHINQKNVDTLGSAKHEIEGRFIQDFDRTSQHQPDLFFQMWDKLRHGQPQMRYLHLNVGDQPVCIQEHYIPIMDKDGTLLLIVNIGTSVNPNPAPHNTPDQA